jgi:hypothetical protein
MCSAISVSDADVAEMIAVEATYLSTHWANCEILLGNGKRTFVSGPRMSSTLRRCHQQPQFWFKPFGDNPKQGKAESEGWVTLTPIAWIAQCSGPFLAYIQEGFSLAQVGKSDENIMLTVMNALGDTAFTFGAQIGLVGYDAANVSGFSVLTLLFILRPPRLWLAEAATLQSLAMNIDSQWRHIAKEMPLLEEIL